MPHRCSLGAWGMRRSVRSHASRTSRRLQARWQPDESDSLHAGHRPTAGTLVLRLGALQPQTLQATTQYS